jgi:acyl-CoA thioester hydrolase
MQERQRVMAHELTVKIYYEDTDAGGVVYYANYLRYMERARTEFLAERGIDIYRLQREGSLFVVARVEADYRRAAVLGDMLTVTTEVRELRHASLVLAHRVLRGDELLVEGAVTMVHVDDARRPRRLTEEFKRRLGA